MVFVLQAVPNLSLGDENIRKNHVPMSQKALFSILFPKDKKLKKL